MFSIEEFKQSIEKQIARNEKKETEKINDLKTGIKKFSTFSRPDFIEGKDIFSFATRNHYIVGEMVFEVACKRTGNRFLAYYYPTENSFVDAFDYDNWIYDRSKEWENQLDDYKAIPVFIDYKK